GAGIGHIALVHNAARTVKHGANERRAGIKQLEVAASLGVDANARTGIGATLQEDEVLARLALLPRLFHHAMCPLDSTMFATIRNALACTGSVPPSSGSFPAVVSSAIRSPT